MDPLFLRFTVLIRGAYEGQVLSATTLSFGAAVNALRRPARLLLLLASSPALRFLAVVLAILTIFDAGALALADFLALGERLDSVEALLVEFTLGCGAVLDRLLRLVLVLALGLVPVLVRRFFDPDFGLALTLRLDVVFAGLCSATVAACNSS